MQSTMYYRLAVCLIALLDLATAARTPHVLQRKPDPGFEGCPYQNDFYTEGIITSPYYPSSYPSNIKCWYWLQAEFGSVLEINFATYDVDTVGDYVTIYDGYGLSSPILAQFGGPNKTADKPTGPLYTRNRFALMTFTTDLVITKSGFNMTYKSVSTAYPCNRDILLVINGFATLGTPANYQKQLDFIANNLVANWTINGSKTRAMINLQVSADYAIIYTGNDSSTTTELQENIRGLSDYSSFLFGSNNTHDLESLFRYSSDEEQQQSVFTHREGIQKVQIVFISNDANNDQDFYEAEEYAHILRNQQDTKVITVAMGSVNSTRLSKLAYASDFAFTSSYDNLTLLTDKINEAICKKGPSNCGV